MELSKILKLKDKLEKDMMKMLKKFEAETGSVCHQIIIFGGKNRVIHII